MSINIFFNAVRAVVLAMVVSILVIPASWADNPRDWWVDIKNNRVASVKQMLAQGANPNEVSPNGQPSIMHAIRESAWDVYDLLANNSSTALNAINVNRETALMYLVLLGQTERAELLISRGAMVNRIGWTPLHYAASTGQLDAARMLLRHDAQINAVAHDGTTPIMMAAYGGSEPMVRLLLDAGADLYAKTEHGYTVVDWAGFKSHTRLRDKLQNLIDRQLNNFEEITEPPVTVAAENPENNKTSTSKYFDLDRDFDADIMTP